MENQDKLHQQFKEAAGKAEQKDFARMDAVWNRVEEKLDNNKHRRTATLWKYTGMAALFLLFMGLGVFMLNNEKNNPVTAPTATPQNSVTVIDTQKVKETFDPAKAEPRAAVVTTEKTSKKERDADTYILHEKITKREKDSIYFIKNAKFTQSTNTKNPEYVFNAQKIRLVPGNKTEDVTPATAYVEASSAKTKETENSITVEIEKRPLTEGATASVTSAQQSKAVTGVILDSEGLPVPGASIMVAGTTKTASTDFDGKYMIDAKEGEKLVASFIGMQTQTVTLGPQKGDVNFKLADDASTLDEVVVVASGTAGRKARREERKEAKKAVKTEGTALAIGTPVTVGTPAEVEGYISARNAQKNANAAVTTVTTNPIEGRPNASFVQTMQEQDVPGVNISPAYAAKTIETEKIYDSKKSVTGTEPGVFSGNSDKTAQTGEEIANDHNYRDGDLAARVNYTVQYDTLDSRGAVNRALPDANAKSNAVARSAGSLNKDDEPLYVVNGIPTDSKDIAKIDAKDIVSISVLKDAGATAVYGKKGVNGVIVIKTKQALTKKEQRKLDRLNKKKQKRKP